MNLELKKFGVTLVSRQAGKEALAAFRPNLAGIKPEEIIKIDFNGVIAFSPSWGDEFLTPLFNQFGDRLILLPTDNLSVKTTLQIVEKTLGKHFRRA